MAPETVFHTMSDGVKVKMFNYPVFDGWYDEHGQKMDTDDTINSSLSLYARFKTSDGKIYAPKLSPIDEAITPPVNSGSSDHDGSSVSTSLMLFGTWQQDAAGWWFKTTTGSYPQSRWGLINGNWFYFNSDGYMATGWTNVDQHWYYLNPEAGATQGVMKTGWLYDDAYGSWFYLSSSGEMLTGWQQIGGVWYYLNPQPNGQGGAMLHDQWIGNYYVDSTGAFTQTR